MNEKEHISTENYKQAANNITRIMTQLCETLSEPERTLLERLTENYNEVIGETGAAEFKIGFAMGAQMIIDCLAVFKNDIA